MKVLARVSVNRICFVGVRTYVAILVAKGPYSVWAPRCHSIATQTYAHMHTHKIEILLPLFLSLSLLFTLKPHNTSCFNASFQLWSIPPPPLVYCNLIPANNIGFYSACRNESFLRPRSDMATPPTSSSTTTANDTLVGTTKSQYSPTIFRPTKPSTSATAGLR